MILVILMMALSTNAEEIPVGISVMQPMDKPVDVEMNQENAPVRPKRQFLAGLLLGSLIGGHHHHGYHHHHHRPQYYGGYNNAYGYRYIKL